MLTMKKSIVLLLFFFFSNLIPAQIPTLEIPVKNGDYKQTKDVILQKLNLEVKITANISTTVATMVFKNNSNRILEGRLTFPLPENVSVSGYALDINGKLRNAVPVEKAKAKEVFESIEKRNVDPGILEKVEGNNFRTRIYPIPANGERTVQIIYNQELKKTENQLQYYLPLDYKAGIPSFSLKTSVFEKINTPQLEDKPDGSFNFIKNGNIWVAEITKTNYKSTGNLIVNLPQKDNENNALMQKASGNSYYFLANVPINSTSRAKKIPREIAIIWDNSLSGLQRNHEREFQLLDEYFKVLKNVSVKVYFLNNQFEEGKKFQVNNLNYAGITNWESLKKYLSETIYDGGTDFSAIKSVNADDILFFSDGLSNFGDLDLNLNKPVYTIISSSKANFSQMKYISLKTGGEFLNIHQNLSSQEVKKLLFQNLKFLGIKENKDLSEVYPQLPQTINNNLVLSGISTEPNSKITLLFGYGNETTQEKTISLNAENQTTNEWDISKFWAQKKIAELEIFEDQNKEEIRNLGKQFGIATNNTSLIVLENVQDYAKYEIFPPQELRGEYDHLVKNSRDQKENRMTNIMEKAETMTENLKNWWNTEFKDEKKYPKPLVGETQIFSPTQNMIQTLSGSVAGLQIRRDSATTQDIEGVVVTAMGIRRETRNLGYSTKSISEENIASGKITTIDVKSDAEYMKSFDKLNSAETVYNEYLKQRNTYLQTPSFYFDVSKLLFQKKDKKLGLKVLSSIADLNIENEELYKLLIYKLKEQNITDKEVWIAKKVLDWQPMDPQSYRDYALALEDDGKPQQALDELYKIFNKSYTQELANRDRGIEETIIMEINSLISRNGNNINTTAINPKLIADLPVNIRVVLNWNKDNTDIDLWVTDPNGEKCMYSHKSTEIGGRLSDDFTGGFGPEQFLLKKAIKGKYKMETNFYGENQVTLTGPTAIFAEIYLNYASGKQQRKLVVFQNEKKSKEGNGDGILIGEFEF